MNVNVNLIEENVTQIIGGIMINVDTGTQYIIYVKKIWIPSTCSCKNGKYLASIIDISVITCDEIIDGEAKSNNEETKKFNEISNKF